MQDSPVNIARRRLLLGTLAALGMDAVQAATWQKLNTATGDAGKWNKLNVDAGTGWRKLGGAGGRVVVNLTIAANTQNYNIFNNRGGTYVAGLTDVVLTINAGVVVGSSSTASYSLDTGTGWAAGDTVAIVNNGYIAGKGGAGGNQSWVAQNGTAGGPSLALRWPVTITNGAGYIYSGGGGGGNGDTYQWGSASSPHTELGRAGGGGAGNNIGLAGVGATAATYRAYNGGLAAGGRGGGLSGGAGGILGLPGARGPYATVGGGGGGAARREEAVEPLLIRAD